MIMNFPHGIEGRARAGSSPGLEAGVADAACRFDCSRRAVEQGALVIGPLPVSRAKLAAVFAFGGQGCGTP